MTALRPLLHTTWLVVPFAIALLACSAESSEADDEAIETDEAAQTGSADLSASYVGRFQPPPGAPGGMFAELLLKTDRSYELRAGAAAEAGSFRVRATSTGPKLVLSPSTGGTRSYHAALGAGYRPRLTLRRGRTTQELEREPLGCDGVACTAGHACAVEERRGVPGPVCSAVAPALPAWRAALAGHDVWGATLHGVLEPYSGIRKNLYCTVLPTMSLVYCNTMWVGEHATLQLSVGVAPDGTFDRRVGAGTAVGDQKLRGRIEADGTVVVEFFDAQTCYQTSSFWCEGHKTDMVGRAAPVAICRTRDEYFASGGSASGYWVPCTECRDRCVGP